MPCSHIVLNNINLETRDGTAEVYCNSATGIGYGYIHPSAECLTSSDKKIKQKMHSGLEEPREGHIVHTELWIPSNMMIIEAHIFNIHVVV